MKGKFNVYKSSAGSGKTYTLVKEFLRICLTSKDLYGFSRILAITFTNKATFEMKQRILLALKQIGNQDSKVVELMQSLQEETGLAKEELVLKCQQILTAILHSYADFGISTIDKFTHRLVRTFAKDLGLSPTFKVELEASEVLNEVIDLLIDQLGIDEALSELLIQFAFSRMEDEKTWKIDKEMFQFAMQFFQEQSFPYLKELRELPLSSYKETFKTYNKALKNFEKKIKGIGKEAMELIAANRIDKSSLFGGGVIYNFFLRFQEFDLKNLSPVPTAVKSIEEDKWLAGKCTSEQANAIEGIKSQLADLFHKGVAYHKENIKNYLAIRETLKYIHSLRLLNHIEKKLNEYKKDEKILNISDFNQLISSIVEHEPMPFIYERLGDKYQHLMIDEFQDTSVLQFSNLLPLVENSLAQGFENLIVGDAKQAIYRFRGGEVEQFSEMPHYVLPEIQQNELYLERMQTLAFQYNKTDLATNYRSLTEVVHFNNAFFEYVKNDANLTPKIKTIFEGHQQKTLAKKSGGYVEIQFIEGEKSEERSSLYQQNILDIIQRSLEKGYQLKDIAILVRKKSQGRDAAEFLKANDINVLSSEALLLRNDNAVNFLIRFAQWIFQPQTHLYRKEIIEYLVEQKFLSGKLHDYYTMEATGKSTQSLLDETGLAIDVEHLKLLASHEFFEEIIRMFGLDKTYNVYLQFLQDAVFDYFKSNKGNVQSFLDWWEENQERFSISTSDDTNAVSIMTIHKSKGLEFPVCIVPFAEQEIAQHGPMRTNLIWTKTATEPSVQLPYALVEFGNDLQNSELSAAYDTELEKLQIDFMCDNYVAFTRAVDALFVLTAQYKMPKSAPSNPSLVKLPQLINAFVEQSGLDSNGSAVTWGEFPSKLAEHNSKEEEYPLNYLSSPWSDKIKISASSQSTWKENEPIQYGILMHEILGEITSIHDVEEVLQRYKADGSLNGVEFETMGKKLNQIVTNAQIQPFFDEKYSVKQEASMLSSSGKLLRPDRVVFWENKTVILDFKTGEKNEAHHNQMKEYQFVLEEISTNEVEAYLLYTETEELVKV
ncbi:MAG: ATP-dependent exoDNAse (exonuclease V) beta subunit [Vicingaceae bacterium]|jgi:ATP-dependent exoDNAse (exonuclease V) beta subunit